jgi:hypothetical protein
MMELMNILPDKHLNLCRALQGFRCYRLGKRRITASSRSNGRFVAPRIRIRWLSLDLRPSQAAINSFRILLVASCSNAPPLAPSKLSTYNNQTVSYQEVVQNSKLQPKDWQWMVQECISICVFFHFSKHNIPHPQIWWRGLIDSQRKKGPSWASQHLQTTV